MPSKILTKQCLWLGIQEYSDHGIMPYLTCFLIFLNSESLGSCWALLSVCSSARRAGEEEREGRNLGKKTNFSFKCGAGSFKYEGGTNSRAHCANHSILYILEAARGLFLFPFKEEEGERTCAHKPDMQPEL